MEGKNFTVFISISAVFSIAGEQTSFTPGRVTFDGSRVNIDVSSLPDATEGLLVFQLLNQDTDIKSVVKVSNLSSEVDTEGVVNPLFEDNPRIAAIGEELDLNSLSQTNTLQPVIDNVSFNSSTGKYEARLRVKNSGEAIGRNVAVIFDNLPDGVTIENASGTDASGNPYLNLRNTILSGGLDSGAISDAVKITFNNPNLVRFGLNTRVLTGGANQAPTFEPLAPVTIMPGSKLTIPLNATDPEGDLISYQIANTEALPTGTLSDEGKLILTPTASDLGSYQITLIASDGVAQTEQTLTVDVIADPVTTTRVSGVIENVQQEPLAGVVIELGDLQTVTGADGSFTIETDQPLTADTLIVRGESIPGDKVYPYIAEKLPLVLGGEVQVGFSNVIDRPIYLPAFDVASGQTINPNQDVTVTTENIPGAAVTVNAGSLKDQEGDDFTGVLSITEVPTDLTPAALPENLVPDLVVTIQRGEMVFDTPAPLSLPNRAGWAAGTEMDLWSINPATGNFNVVGQGRVSDDGNVVKTIEGGIRNSSWHFFVPPLPPFKDDPKNEDKELPQQEDCNLINSTVKSHSGALGETHNLVTYNSNGATRGLTLYYDSQRADPREIVNFGFDNFTNTNDLYLFGKLSVLNSSTGLYSAGKDNIWSIPQNQSGISGAMQTDLSNYPSGVHSYNLSAGIVIPQGKNWSGSTNQTSGKLVSVNSIHSPFGSGWGISGWQELVENFDGSVLLIDGGGEELVFDKPATAGSSVYVSPSGDFSTLEKLPDGTFRRTMKDQTVYTFNSNLQLSSVQDRNGNETQYIYDTSNKLIEIIDPVGLKTSLTYNGEGKVSQITDPAGKLTLLNYDAAGNLISVTDPDTTTRTWEYDSKHHMTAEVDQRGNREETYYNFAGRVVGGKRKDGSTVSIASVQSENLLPPTATTSITSGGKTRAFSNNIYSAYVDGLGNPKFTQLDSAGQAISAKDGEGSRPSTSRNTANLITSSFDSRGNETTYQYDSRGNLTRIEDASFSSKVGGTVPSLFLEPFSYNIADSVFKDINQDGILDLIGLVQYLSQVSVYLGNGDGTFSSKTNYSTNKYAKNLEIEDLNNDGVLDIITVSNFNSNISVLLGKGDGTFATNVDYLTGVSPRTINLEDLNNDSVLDIVTLNNLSDNISVLLGKGNGTFAPKVDYSIGDSSRIINLEDFNHDSVIDIVTTNAGSSNVSVLLGKGDGTFANKVNYSTGVNPSKIAIEDFNHDSFVDFAVSNFFGSTVSILLGKGDGTFASKVNYSTIANFPSLSLKDLDSDGDLDLITQSSSSVGIHFNNIDGAVEKAKSGARTYTYDTQFNQLTSTTDELGHTTLYDINPNNGNNLSTTRVVGAVGGTITNSYDGVGNLVALTDELNRTTTFAYDNLNRKTNFTDPLGHIYTTQYDAVGNVIAEIDPLNNQTTYDYDANGLLTSTTDAENRTTNYSYDGVGNLLALTDPEQNTTSYTYDGLNRLITDTNQLGDTQTYEYDAVGNLIAHTDRNGFTTGYVYDELNRQTADGGIVYNYDAASQLTNVSDDYSSSYSYQYDAAGRLTQVDNYGTWDAPNVIFNYQYDAVNNLTSVTDTIYGVASGVENYQYDALNRVTNITQSGNGVSDKRVDFSYDAASQRTSLRRYSDLTGNNLIAESNYTYDNGGRLTDLVHQNNNNVLADYKYKYDAVNRITQFTTSDGTSNYSYDNTDQLINADHSYQSDENYTYDDNGNRTNAGYVIGANNRLLSDGTYNYQYNSEGNLTKRTEIATGTHTDYDWDSHHNLTRAFELDNQFKSLERVYYDYDALDRRIEKTAIYPDGDDYLKEYYLYNGDEIALVFDENVNLKERFFYGVGVDEVLASEDANGEVNWSLGDNLNSIRTILDKDGNVINRINYDAFGAVTSETNPNIDFRFGYTGQELDSETGLYNYGRRFYNPGTGRFLSEDPLGFAAGDANLYRYVGNNPINLVDPYGLCAVVANNGFVHPAEIEYSIASDSNVHLTPFSNNTAGDTKHYSKITNYEYLQPGKEYLQRSSDGGEILVDYQGNPLPNSFEGASISGFSDLPSFDRTIQDTEVLIENLAMNLSNSNNSGKFKVELRYRNTVFPGTSHADIVITRPDGTIRSYWGKAQSGSPGFFGELTIDQETDNDGIELGYEPGNPFYVDDPERIQEVDSNDSDDSNIEERIIEEFQRIENADIPYNPLKRNSNSAAFEVLEKVLGERPTPIIKVPGWDINPYTGKTVEEELLESFNDPNPGYNPYQVHITP
jgi:RHS repeat-associated protein